MKFVELLRWPPGCEAGVGYPTWEAAVDAVRTRQESAQRLFPAVLREHGLTLRTPGDPISTAHDTLVLGIAACYSPHELEFLDRAWKGLKDQSDDRIEVFDTCSVETAADLEALLPGFGEIIQTPCLGVWKRGKLVQRQFGGRVFAFLRSRYGMDGGASPSS
jgi:hypothetical protein